MKSQRIVATTQSKIAVEDFELPSLEPDQVLIETQFSAISPGTELAFLHHLPNTPGVYPYYPGYSSSGHVADKGSAVTDLEVGQRVACKISHAAHAIVEAGHCIPIPDGVSNQDASIYRLNQLSCREFTRPKFNWVGRWPCWDYYPGERLIVCYNPVLAAERKRKREDLLQATEKQLQLIEAATTREKRRLRGRENIGVRIGRVLNKYKVGKHYQIEITDDGFTATRNQDRLSQEAALRVRAATLVPDG